MVNLLKLKNFLACLFVALLLGVAAFNCSAESAGQCHCFKARSYNQAARFAADGYILATSFNSLLSKYYGLAKRQIIMIKMNQGVTQRDLLIALKLAKITGQDLKEILLMHREEKSWPMIIAELPSQEAVQNDAILANLLNAGISADEAAILVAEEMLAEFFKVQTKKIATLKTAGLNVKEMTLLFILAHLSEIHPEALMAQYRVNGRSWSEIAYNLGVEPQAAGKLILAYPDRTISE